MTPTDEPQRRRPARPARLSLHLAERFGDTDGAGRAHIPLTLSRAALSRLVSARVETVIRVASDWQKRGLIATDAAGFQLHDPAALQAIVDEHPQRHRFPARRSRPSTRKRGGAHREERP